MKRKVAIPVKVGFKRQSEVDRRDESLGERNGRESMKKQSFKDRRKESRGEERYEREED